jgi:hypothetical protein
MLVVIKKGGLGRQAGFHQTVEAATLLLPISQKVLYTF